MVGATGIAIDSSTLDEGSGLRLVYQCGLRVFMNRPVRTRTPGGVGGERENLSSTRLDRTPLIALNYIRQHFDRYQSILEVNSLEGS
jgi:hypothetical protein